MLNKKNKNILSFVFIIICLISLIIGIINYNNIPKGYNMIISYPIIYLFLFYILLDLLSITDYKVTISFFMIFQFFRFVITPTLIFLGGDDSISDIMFISPEDNKQAILLIIYEFFITFLLVNILGRKKIKNKNIETDLIGSNFVYKIFIFISVIIFLMFLIEGVKLINFILIPVGTGDRIGDETNTSIVLARQFLILSVIFLFLLVSIKCKKKYEKTKKNKYINYGILAAIFSICIIIGERRSAQIYTAICCGYILFLLFPENKNKIIKFLGLTAIIILAFMSIYKISYAFIYDSYIDAIKNSVLDMGDLAKMFQSYFAGPNNVALGIKVGNQLIGYEHNYIYDTLRSIVPISFFVKNQGTVTSVLFNNILYNGTQNSGHVLSSLSYGYTFFGVILSPIFTIINIIICFFFERKMKQTKSLEMKYIYMYCLLRFSINFMINTPALLSACTIMLFTGGIVYLFSKYFRKLKEA